MLLYPSKISPCHCLVSDALNTFAADDYDDVADRYSRLQNSDFWRFSWSVRSAARRDERRYRFLRHLVFFFNSCHLSPFCNLFSPVRLSIRYRILFLLQKLGSCFLRAHVIDLRRYFVFVEAKRIYSLNISSKQSLRRINSLWLKINFL